MAEITVNMSEHLPGAEYLTAPSIAFGEEATHVLVAAVSNLVGMNAQITVPTGSFAANIADVGIEFSIYGVRVIRVDSETMEPLGEPAEFVSFLDLRRILMY